MAHGPNIPNNPSGSSYDQYVTDYEFGGKKSFRPIIVDSFTTEGIGVGDLVVVTSLAAPANRLARDCRAREDRWGLIVFARIMRHGNGHGRGKYSRGVSFRQTATPH